MREKPRRPLTSTLEHMADKTQRTDERPSDFESAAHALVGRLLFTYSRLDVNLALYVANRYSTSARDDSILKLEKLSFKEKLDWVLPAVAREYPANEACEAEWSEWFQAANEVRTVRNRLVHGRWGISEHHQRVSNISGLPGSPNQDEIQYTLTELQAEVQRAVDLSSRFYSLSKNWPT